MRRSVLILCGILIAASAASAQTIHKDDLDYFVGAFSKVENENPGTAARQISIDCSRFVEWRLIKPDSSGRRNFDQIKYSKDRHWVWDWMALTDQAGEVKWHYRPQYYDPKRAGYRYYILQDFTGHEWQQNVLTIWEPVGCDSLRYVCGQTGDFGTSIGHASVKLVTVLPDSSLLLVADRSGEGQGAYCYYVSPDGRHFTPFYICEWHAADENFTSFADVTVDLQDGYGVYERWQYLSVVRTGGKERLVADSIVTRHVNILRLAEQFARTKPPPGTLLVPPANDMPRSPKR